MKCIHHWLIDSTNKGKCIKCGASKDFAPACKRAFPEDYGGLKMNVGYKFLGNTDFIPLDTEYCKQGHFVGGKR